MKLRFLTLITALIFTFGNAQKEFKFGKVSEEEVSQKEHPLEKDAEAAILYKKERVFYDYDAENGFRTIRDAHYRIKVYNKNGLSWGTIQIPLYTSNNGEERVSSIKGYTYNLAANGKIEEYKLKKDGIFKENINRYRNQVSVAMPEVKEGSVIDLEFRIASDFAGYIGDFKFQFGIPVNLIDVSVAIPQYFIFKRYGRGYYPINLTESTKNRKIQFLSKGSRNFDDGSSIQKGTNINRNNLQFFENVYAINATDIPSLKQVDFTDNVDNYRSALKFELASTQFPNSPYKNYSLSWEDVAETIYKSDYFGVELDKKRLVKDIVAKIQSQSQDANELVQKIYDYVKNNLTWNEYYGKYCENGIKKVLDEKTGNVADINLTLVAMLRQAGLKADPVLLSTKSHGIPLFPTREGFNYVIAAVDIGNGLQFLDATEKMGTPGILPVRVMNWNGRLVKEDGSSMEINLTPKKAAKKLIFINANILEDGSVNGKLRSQLTNNYAFDYRVLHKDDTLEEMMDGMEEQYVEMEIDELDIKNLEDLNKPIVESCSFYKENQVELISGKLYLKPSLFMGLYENPFKMENREYPLDFEFPKSNRITVNYTLPEGYRVESVPDNVVLGLPDGLGSFKYTIRASGNQLQFSSTTDINAAIVPATYYQALKEFFNQIVTKQSENVVLTKA